MFGKSVLRQVRANGDHAGPETDLLKCQVVSHETIAHDGLYVLFCGQVSGSRRW
jgi:hypothetical protein